MSSRSAGGRNSRKRAGGDRGRDNNKRACYDCGDGGHIARNCPSRKSGTGASTRNSQPRDRERGFFDRLTKDANSSIESSEEATRLLRAALTFAEVEGGSALCYRLVDAVGTRALLKSLEYITDQGVFVNGFLPLVQCLGQDELHKPVYLTPMNSLLSRLYLTPFLVPCILEHCKNGRVTTNDEKTSLIWFITRIALESSNARQDESVKEIAEIFKHHGGSESLQTVLAGSLVSAPGVSLAKVRQSQADLPGGRHSNDEEDYRSISIIPTLDEFMCDAEPYLPKTHDSGCKSEAQLLDCQFRLLREDIIGPSKEQQDDPRKQQRDIFYGVRVHRVESGAAVCHKKDGKEVKIMGPSEPCIVFKFHLPKGLHVSRMKATREREDYWDKNRRVLPKDALMCLQRCNGKNNWVPIRFGIISRRETKELAGVHPMIGLSFLTDQDTSDTLKELSDQSVPPTRLFVISGDLFAYQPILRGLQLMHTIPFADEIIRCTQVALADDQSTCIPSSMREKVKMLDSKQSDALQHALNNRVSLIQGPPGTGKTFIGVLLTQIILSTPTPDQILCVTYTNHALDDFLEDLLDAGITDIVRLGGRSKNDRLSQYNLREQASSGKMPFTREQTRRYAQLKGTIEDAEKDVTRLERELGREIGEKWWARVRDHLQDHHADAWRQLEVASSDLEDREGFLVQGISGEDYLWKCWLKGKRPPASLRTQSQGALWHLSKEERRQQKVLWQHELYADKRSAMMTALKTIQTAKAELKQLKEVTDAFVLSKAKVIGCTTTKAAMCKNLLEGVSAGIVLVEEAAEIMEAHVLTSLSSGSKRLIMIGDHKQLRPKCQHYPLTVESGRGFDLNRSLFERLALTMPISTLSVQHRMHPDISSIPKLVTYTDLQDAPSVCKHPHPKGLQSRIVFIDHGVPEDQENNGSDSIESVSRTNGHEVGMVVATVRYLFQQGYKASDLVVLTPYLGQMTKLHNALAVEFEVFVNDRDLAEARDCLGDSEGLTRRKEEAPPGKTLVRVATIDNYQGEEANIVIVSLVRSNPNGLIGFLKEPERVNVMLSRARDCEIIIGNRKTFESAKGSHDPLRGGPLWRKICESLESLAFVFRGLPTKCQIHKTQAIMGKPGDFARLCPDGGCTKACDKLLECEHPCKMRCHVGPCKPCDVLCQDKCGRGHSLMKACSADLPRCKYIISWRCPLGHPMSGPCFAGKYSNQCKHCSKLKKDEDASIAMEGALQSELDRKSNKLTALKLSLGETQRLEGHKGELARMEAELALVKIELRGSLKTAAASVNAEVLCDISVQPKPSGSITVNGSDDPPNTLDDKVRMVLKKSHPRPLDSNSLLSQYKLEFGSDLKLDAAELLQSRKKQKLKGVLYRLQCCEVIMESNIMLVRLRDDASDKVTSGMDATKLADNLPQSTRTDESGAPPSTDSKPDEKRLNILSPGRQGGNGTTLMRCSSSDGAMDTAASGHPMSLDAVGPADVSFTSFREENHPPQQDGERVRRTSASAPAVDDDAVIINVLQRYSADGALSADNLLDEILSSSEAATAGIRASQWIIRKELDPQGICQNPPSAESTQSTLSQALCVVANAMYLFQQYPLLAREQALSLLKHGKSLYTALPVKWAEIMQEIGDSSYPLQELCLSRTAGTSLSAVSGESISDKWKAIVQNDAKAPSIMCDSILPMIGLAEVKHKFVDMYHRVKLSQEQGDGAAASYNIRFEGNPGTGKTTIARLYGSFLRQLSVLPEKSLFKETSGAKLIHDGIKALQDMLKDLKVVGGGIIFVDEAYQLVSDQMGKKVLDFIMPLAEGLNSEFGAIVWVFAGYKKQMETLFEYNDGLPSRFPLRFVFADYTDAELQKIFEDLMRYKERTSTTAGRPVSPISLVSPRGIRNSYRSYNRGHGYAGQTMTGRFGRTWTFQATLGWTDKYGNMTVNPADVGSRTSELASKEGVMWIEADGLWTGENGNSQTHCPGSPAPVKSSKREERCPPFQCDERHLRLAIRRLGRRRGENGFGNARAVRVLFDSARDRQAPRIIDERSKGKEPDIYLLKRTDFLGPEVTKESLKKSSAWVDLEAMEGLTPVKESVEQLFKLVLANIDREMREQPLYEVALNRLFLGNPGTGKTTVAKLYGQILVDLGLLSKGEVILKCASDFVGDALGTSEKLTQNTLKAAEGSVLVIDEAYSLYSGGVGTSGSNDPYKTAVIDTIVEKVQAKPGADIAVVMLGYQAEMKHMMRKVNPGLSRRFQTENAFIFPDFDDAALVRIMMASARKKEISLSLGIAKRAVQKLAKARAKPNFGNAGSVDNLLSKAITRMQMRDKATELIADDFGYSGDGPDTGTLDSLFDDLIGCNEVRKTMELLRDTVEFSKAHGKPASSGVSFNYLFLGNPGTGKTSVARRMGVMFNALGLLPGDELKEAKASDLVTGYTGQAGKLTREILKESRGGVLFIDEAYQLDPARGGHYMTEAVDELVGALTEEEFKGKILVILAGYDTDMENMLKTNAGLQSRFSERVHFHDFDANATVELLQLELSKLDIPLGVPDLNDVCRLAQTLVDSANFGNGRDVVTWAESVYKVVARKFAKKKAGRMTTTSITSSFSDVEEALDDVLHSREARSGGQTCTTARKRGHDAMATQDSKEPPLPTATSKMVINKQVDEDEDIIGVDESPGEEAPNLFDGMDINLLRSLQNFVDEQGLGSQEGARRLAQLDPQSSDFAELVMRLERELEMSPAEAKAQLLDWQSKQKDLEEMVQEQLTKSKTMGARPIWRCGVCGRADKPWIACYVAPFIVRYEKIPVGE